MEGVANRLPPVLRSGKDERHAAAGYWNGDRAQKCCLLGPVPGRGLMVSHNVCEQPIVRRQEPALRRYQQDRAPRRAVPTPGSTTAM